MKFWWLLCICMHIHISIHLAESEKSGAYFIPINSEKWKQNNKIWHELGLCEFNDIQIGWRQENRWAAFSLKTTAIHTHIQTPKTLYFMTASTFLIITIVIDDTEWKNYLQDILYWWRNKLLIFVHPTGDSNDDDNHNTYTQQFFPIYFVLQRQFFSVRQNRPHCSQLLDS